MFGAICVVMCPTLVRFDTMLKNRNTFSIWSAPRPIQNGTREESGRRLAMPAGDEPDVLAADKVPTMQRDSQEELRLPRRIAEALEGEDALGVRHRR